MSETLLREIADYCRRARMAESTFGRLAVNDGKLVSRLRLGGRVTGETVARVRGFIERPPTAPANGPRVPDDAPLTLGTGSLGTGSLGTANLGASNLAPERAFRFYDNRQKYLLFVTTCSEKWVIAQRVGMELANLHPCPPALRAFDAGMGDGTVLARTMRAMHHRFPTMPFYIVGKEISLEDVRLMLEKMPDRLYEHPATVLVVTNLYYSEAPWLKPNTVTAATSLVWHELALTGNTAGRVPPSGVGAAVDTWPGAATANRVRRRRATYPQRRSSRIFGRVWLGTSTPTKGPDDDRPEHGPPFRVGEDRRHRLPA